LDYIPQDEYYYNGPTEGVAAEKTMSLRNLWLFISFTIFPIILIVAQGVLVKHIQRADSSRVVVALAEPTLARIGSPSFASTANPSQISNIATSLGIETVKPLVATIRHKDSLDKIFKRNGLDRKAAIAILSLKQAKPLRNLQIGKKLTLGLNSDRTAVQSLEYDIDKLNTLTVTASSKGGWSVKTKHVEPSTNTKYAAAIVNGSIYSAGKKAGVPYKLMEQFVSAFSNKVNVRKISNGDKFAFLYKEYTLNGEKVKDSEIAAAELIHKGEVYRIVGFTDTYGNTNFYTPNGYSLKPTFERYPVSFKHISSRFTHARHHPIYGEVRPHLGVDLAANAGTPIRATGNGRIVFAGSRSGYGRSVIIKHGIYSTLYAHLSRFSNNIYSGGYVKKGQVIGFVGSSGVSTGPHLHYEFHVNGVPKDPLKVKLPAGGMIASEHRQVFFNSAKKLLAQLDSQHKINENFVMNSYRQVKKR
jgi:murein DD-endopeptidase MepM/ murein hydrolase activator NlpD